MQGCHLTGWLYDSFGVILLFWDFSFLLIFQIKISKMPMSEKHPSQSPRTVVRTLTPLWDLVTIWSLWGPRKQLSLGQVDSSYAPQPGCLRWLYSSFSGCGFAKPSYFYVSRGTVPCGCIRETFLLIGPGQWRGASVNSSEGNIRSLTVGRTSQVAWW